MLWYHNSEEIIGEWTKMEEDDKGLYVEGKLWVNGESKLEKAVQAYNVLKSNSVKGLSIGYRVTDKEMQENFDGGIIRKLKEIDLLELSIAPYAMNPQASVTGVKSMTDDDGNILSKRDVERILRDAGLSKRQSKAFIAGGYGALERDAKDSLEVAECDAQSDVSTVLETLKNSFPTI
jgi:HK97 family phage prohead protease